MHRIAIAFLAVTLSFTALARDQDRRPERVDLRKWQTPVRSQVQGSCYIHANVAAMEAAYKRLGYGDLNLSEDFSYYFNSLLWLKRNPYNAAGQRMGGRLRVPPLPERECGLPFFDHAPESGNVDGVKGMFPLLYLPIPTERDFPQDPQRYQVPWEKHDPRWNSQRKIGNIMFESRRIPRTGLTAPAYYQIEKIVVLPAADAMNPDAIEAVLARGIEVVWDYRMQGDTSGPVWRFNQAKDPNAGGHRMLIVGYDRSDPANPYFLVKNSWGVEDTRIGYDFLAYGEWASYIESVKAPRPLPELKWIGRWSVEFGQLPGELDIYHVPALFQPTFDQEGPALTDRRIGTLFVRGEEAGPAFRVNGTMRGDGLELFLELSRPDLGFDERSGDRIVLREVAPDRLEGTVFHAGGGRSPARAHRIEVGENAPAALRAVPVATVETAPAPAGEEIGRRFAEARQLIARDVAIGQPLEQPILCADGRGWRQAHEGADLYLAPGHHPVAIYGDIRALWLAEGAERGRLGYPLTDELDGGFGRRMSKLENGTIWWHPERGAWIELAQP